MGADSFGTRIKADDLLARHEPFLEWLREHKLEPNLIKQVVILGGWMSVWQFATDAEGSKFVNKLSEEAVMVETYQVKVLSQPPLASPSEVAKERREKAGV